jgi:hypothetical protein
LRGRREGTWRRTSGEDERGDGLGEAVEVAVARGPFATRQICLEFDNLHMFPEQLIYDLVSIDFLVDRQFVNEVSYFAIQIDRKIELPILAVKFASYAF